MLFRDKYDSDVKFAGEIELELEYKPNEAKEKDPTTGNLFSFSNLGFVIKKPKFESKQD